MKTNEKLVGHVCVDAGLMWFGDPCYVMGDNATHRWRDWGDFCKALEVPGSKYAVAIEFPVESGLANYGVCITHFGGDGVFPVYITTDGRGVVTEARIVFANGH